MPTIDVDDAGAVSNEAIGGCENVVDANAKSNFLNHLEGKSVCLKVQLELSTTTNLVGVFGIDVIL